MSGGRADIPRLLGLFTAALMMLSPPQVTRVEGGVAALTVPRASGRATESAAVSGRRNLVIAGRKPVVTQPLSIVIRSGNNQTDRVNNRLTDALVVRVTRDGVPADGVSVTWSITSGAGSLAAAQTVTDNAGEASNTLTLGSIAGPVTVRASVDATSIDFTATAVLAQTLAKVSGDNQVGVINALLPNPLVVKVLTAGGPTGKGVSVQWAVSPPGKATLGAPETRTDESGVATNTVRLGSEPDAVVSVTASLGGASVTFSVNNGTRAAASGLRQFIALRDLALTTAAVQNRNIGIRLAALRSGLTGGVSIDGLSLGIAGQPLPLGPVASLVSRSGQGGGTSDQDSLFSRVGFFANGQGSFGSRDETEREPGFDFHTAGATVGVDYRFTDEIVLGSAVGYLSTIARFNGSSGDFTARGFSVSLYGAYSPRDELYVDGIATYGSNRYDTRRKISFGGAEATASGSTYGTELAASISAGYVFRIGSLMLGPHGRVNYVKVDIDRFDEKGGDPFNLRVGSQDVRSVTTALGLQAVYTLNTRWAVLSPSARAEWEHEYNRSNRPLQGSLVADPAGTTFTAESSHPDRNYFNLGIGLSATFKEGRSAFVHYEAVLGRAHVTSHAFTGGLRFEF